MLEVAKAAGVPAAAAETCLKDQKLAEAIRKGKEQSYPLKFDVVPAFFVNGVRYGQNLPDDAIDKALPASPSAPAPATTQPQGQTPSAAAPFKLLGWCDLVEKADPAAGKSLRTLDEQLARLATVNLQVAAADRGFQAQCRALNGKFEGPQMDKFSERTYELGLLRGKAADLGDAVRAVLKAEPIASIGKRGAANEADYCAFTLNAIAADLLKQADTLIKGGPIDCPAAGKR
jgi:hypothetical protein